MTGVDTVDTGTADYLLKMVSATRLLGARMVMSGIQPVVAQTMVNIGVGLGEVKVEGTLEECIAMCMRDGRDGRKT